MHEDDTRDLLNDPEMDMDDEMENDDIIPKKAGGLEDVPDIDEDEAEDDEEEPEEEEEELS